MEYLNKIQLERKQLSDSKQSQSRQFYDYDQKILMPLEIDTSDSSEGDIGTNEL